MFPTNKQISFCLYGHGEFLGSSCPGCADHLPPQFLPMRTVEYDLGSHGESYGDVGTLLFIPEDLLQEGMEGESFEALTGLHRCHIINVRSDEDMELEGEDLEDRVAEIEEQQRRVQAQRREHYLTCQLCRELRIQQAGDSLSRLLEIFSQEMPIDRVQGVSFYLGHAWRATLFPDYVTLSKWSGKIWGYWGSAPQGQWDLWQQLAQRESLPEVGWSMQEWQSLRPAGSVLLTSVREINGALRANNGGQVRCAYQGKVVRVYHAKKPQQSDSLLVAGSDGHWFPSEEVWLEAPLS